MKSSKNIATMEILDDGWYCVMVNGQWEYRSLAPDHLQWIVDIFNDPENTVEQAFMLVESIKRHG